RGWVVGGVGVLGAAELGGGVRTNPGQGVGGGGGVGVGGGVVVPRHAVAADQRVHRPPRARAGDRPVGGQRRGGDRAGPDRRRVAAGTVLVGGHLRVHGTGGCGGRGAGRLEGAHVTGPADPAAGLARLFPVHGGGWAWRSPGHSSPRGGRGPRRPPPAA